MGGCRPGRCCLRGGLGARRGWSRLHSSRSGADGMQTRQGEFGSFLFRAVLPGNSVHPKPAFDHQPLPNLHAVLEVLGEVAPPHNFQLSAGIIRPERIEAHVHFRDRSLIVLGVTEGGSLENIHFQNAVIHPRSMR